ncbi:hypothetical protein [Bradyrhizobium sp. CCBAU 53415]|uniref:hypothetical protein n=1 Tax=Bradyrhizobium sp. CCBAU 53415 TaxID=1325119 RepID=UPI002305E9BF|nr:hypothetical protein [Bradyrhizobium sp. CCBAU 53415]
MVSPISHTVTGLSHEDDPLHRGDGRGRRGRHQPRAGRTGLCLSHVLLLDDEDEIRAFFALAKTARTRKLPVWKHLAKTIPAFDFDLSEPKAGETGVLATDKGPVIPPKLYRRYANWSARKKAKVTSQNFQKFLGEGSGGKPRHLLRDRRLSAKRRARGDAKEFCGVRRRREDDQVSAGGAGVRRGAVDAGRGGWEGGCKVLSPAFHQHKNGWLYTQAAARDAARRVGLWRITTSTR